MVRSGAERLRHALLELGFDLFGRLAFGETGTVAHAEHVGVDGEGFLAERAIEHDVRGLAADSRQRDERVPVARHLAAVLGDQFLGQGNHVLGLGVEQPDRLDVLLEAFFAQRDHLLRGLHLGEQLAGRLVDADVRRLCAEHHGDEQLIDIAEFEFGLRIGIVLGEQAEEFEDLILGQGSTSSRAVATRCHAGVPNSKISVACSAIMAKPAVR